MHPIKQLQKLLNPRTNHHGRVIQNNNDVLLIATSKGTQSIQKPLGVVNSYRVGDSVTVINGQIVGKKNNHYSVYVL